MYFYDSENQEMKEEMKESSVSAEIEELSIINFILDELSSRSSLDFKESSLNEILSSLSILERGKTTEKITSLLRKLAKKDKQTASMLFTKKFSSENLFHTIFRDSQLKVEDIVECLEKEHSENIIENASLYAKGKNDRSKDLFEIILPHLIKMERNDEILSLHERHGWVKMTK